MSLFKKVLPFFLLSAIGVLIYHNSLGGPFLFDDPGFISRNPTIRYIAKFDNIWNALGDPTRIVGLYSFAINYYFHGYNVFGYHLVNLIIHICNAFCVFWFLVLLFKSPRLKNEFLNFDKNILAFVVAVIFLTHPLQTQAVSYVTQRFASLATLFYLLSLCFYFQTKFQKKYHWLSWVLSGFFAILGAFTKEIVFTIPFILLLTEVFFFDFKFLKISLKAKLSFAFILLGFLLLIPFLFSFNFNQIFLGTYESGSHKGDLVTVGNYYLTQFRIVSVYLKLLFFPIGQTLDYDFRLSRSFLVPITTLFGAVLIFSTAFFGFVSRKKYPLLAFGIFFGFITMLVESSIIPIRNIIFEHRMYLPMVGWSIAIFSIFLYSFKNKNMFFICCLVCTLVLSFLTYQRNFVWSNEVLFWEDNVKKAPNKDRPYVHLGNAYIYTSEYDKALKAFNAALLLDPRADGTYVNRGAVFLKQKKYQLALKEHEKAIKINPNNFTAYNNRGTVFLKLKKYDLALKDFNKVLKLNWSYAEAYSNKGTVFYKLGRHKEALVELEKAITLNPGYAKAYFNRGSVYLKLKSYEKAIKDFDKAIEIMPTHVKTYNNRAIAFSRLKQFDRAIEDFNLAVKFSPNDASVYHNRGSILHEQKKYLLAIDDFTQAIQLEGKTAQFFFKRSLSYKASGKFQEALEDIKKAIALGFKMDKSYLEDLEILTKN